MKIQAKIISLIMLVGVFEFIACKNDSGSDVYALRDTGPAGGLIFYVDEADEFSWDYLEAAPSDQSTGAEWGCEGTSTGADGTDIGTGEQNTIDIEAGCTTPGTAADICANLTLGGGYSDWFLPSQDELNLMYVNLKSEGVGGFFAVGLYWCSSELSASHAWLQDFSTGNPGTNPKGFNSCRVRAARAF